MGDAASFVDLMDAVRLKDVVSSCVSRKSPDSRGHRTLTDFSRYLAAYYLDLPLPSNTPIQGIFTWLSRADYGEGEGSARDEDERLALASLIPSEYTPRLVTSLLYLSGHLLEATLFLDHFNDLRSQLLMRYIIDSQTGTSLLEEHCRDALVNGLLEWMGEAVEDPLERAKDIEDRISRHVKILLELDAVIGTSLLNELETKAMEVADERFSQLGTRVDRSIDVGDVGCPIVL